MKKVLFYITDPFKELKSTKSLAICSLLIALSVITSIYTWRLDFMYAKFSLNFIFIAIIAMKYGPAIAGLSAAISDVIQYLIMTTGIFQPLITLGYVLVGVIFGIVLYKNKSSVWRIILSKTISTVFVVILLNTLFLVPIYRLDYMTLLIPRTIFYLIALPIEIILLVSTLKTITKFTKS